MHRPEQVPFLRMLEETPDIAAMPLNDDDALSERRHMPAYQTPEQKEAQPAAFPREAHCRRLSHPETVVP